MSFVGTVDDVFTRTGDVVTEEERAAAQWAEHEADMRSRSEWFEANAAPQPLTVELTVTDAVHVHCWEDDGSFDGSFSAPAISFSRRPLHRQDFDGADGTAYGWTSGTWRWRITTYGATLSPAALASLQEQVRAIPDRS
ncbi:hypothetical protein [Flexivirga caeni]|uniref:Uncharacterized protein n=1 Tax=Flexivirga caeni TaxID=2294115 RepID=A0A3M9MHL9_9MICO|nr:hypothetical protein [Flexivirga caeni]RNI24675.1 hypothetical protein EFY87_02930 [Flexivirga caeni]